VLEGELIHHDRTLGRRQHVDDAGVETLLEAQGAAARRHDAQSSEALPSPLDGGIAPEDTHEGHGLLSERATDKVRHQHGPAPRAPPWQPLRRERAGGRPGPPRRTWAGRRREGLTSREEPEEEREYDGNDDGRA